MSIRKFSEFNENQFTTELKKVDIESPIEGLKIGDELSFDGPLY